MHFDESMPSFRHKQNVSSSYRQHTTLLYWRQDDRDEWILHVITSLFSVYPHCCTLQYTQLKNASPVTCPISHQKFEHPSGGEDWPIGFRMICVPLNLFWRSNQPTTVWLFDSTTFSPKLHFEQQEKITCKTTLLQSTFNFNTQGKSRVYERPHLSLHISGTLIEGERGRESALSFPYLVHDSMLESTESIDLFNIDYLQFNPAVMDSLYLWYTVYVHRNNMNKC